MSSLALLAALVAPKVHADTNYDLGLTLGMGVWKTRAGSPTMCKSAALDAVGDGYITGSFTEPVRFGEVILSPECVPGAKRTCHDLFMARYKSNGEFIWVRRVPNAVGYAAAANGSDSVVVAGAILGDTRIGNIELKCGSGGLDILFAKFNLSGDLNWVRHFGGKGIQSAHALASDREGNILIVGLFGDGSLDLGGVTFGEDRETGSFIAKYDSEGRLLWARRNVRQPREQPCGVAFDRGGSAYIAGVLHLSAEDSEMYLAKYDSKGELQWMVSPGGAPSRSGLNVAVDVQGNPYVVGTMKHTREFGKLAIANIPLTGENEFIAKYLPNGELSWVREFRRGDFDFEGAVPVASAKSIAANVVSLHLAHKVRGAANAPVAAAGSHWPTATPASLLTPPPISRAPASLRLEIFKSGEDVFFLWPAEHRDFVLEATDTLLPFPVWLPVTASRREQEGAMIAQTSAVGAAKFYRLRRP